MRNMNDQNNENAKSKAIAVVTYYIGEFSSFHDATLQPEPDVLIVSSGRMDVVRIFALLVVKSDSLTILVGYQAWRDANENVAYFMLQQALGTFSLMIFSVNT